MNRKTPTDFDIAMLWSDSILWVQEHTKLIAVAASVGIAIVALLYGLRLVGKRLSREPNPWRSVIGRALASMKLWFMIPLAAELVATYALAEAFYQKSVAARANFSPPRTALGMLQLRLGNETAGRDLLTKAIQGRFPSSA